ncbi:HAMP domain-containing histidine kinase [Phototrophicus methaneseepsis]|uniref:histidine kinase n=1 Tax=Phototrophicus methaneseepsis TaxID=2710758 RepID=A0A7S8E5Y8_9CHLR|nr:HAMP domain-containing sensor histidine kinase [Phototrophicus methaneseepsis]QPC80976.1 HAMP domain-containing histidine kinase [Phototrophicus methaneseepsis]
MMQSPQQVWNQELRDLLLALVQCQTTEDGIQKLLRHIMMSDEVVAVFWRWMGDRTEVLAQGLPVEQVPLSPALNVQRGAIISGDVPTSLQVIAPEWALIPLDFDEKVQAVVGVFFAEQAAEDRKEYLDTCAYAGEILLSHLQHVIHYEQLIQNQSQFVRVVTHDLRTPLTSMLGFTSMLESPQVGELNERQAYYVTKILSGINQITKLVENIQDAGRYDPETGFYELDRTFTDVMELVDRTVSSYLVPAEKQNIKLQAACADNLPIMNVDVGMLDRALTNLVDNAIKYVPDGGTVTVGADVRDQHVVIWVQDNGYGISEENLTKLFQRHFRIRRREHKRVKGSGLGLFIVRSVAIRHGGDAWVESIEGEGSTFYFKIPLKGENLLSYEGTLPVDVEQ